MKPDDFEKALANVSLDGGVVWRSEVTEDMVAHLTDNELQQLVEALDEAVFHICEAYTASVVSIHHEEK